MALADWTVELYLDGVWTDVSDAVRSVSTRRQNVRRSTATRQYQAGSFTVVLNNVPRTYDPLSNVDVRPGVGVRISCEDSGGAERQFTGRVEAVDIDYIDRGNFSTVTLSGSDAVPRLTKANLVEVSPSVGSGDTVAQRIARVLDAIGWPGGDRDISAGGVTLVATAYGQSALAEIEDAVDADSGEWWIDKLGRVAYRTLSERLAALPVADFAADGTGDAEPQDIVVVYDDELLTNEITYARIGQSSSTVTDASSVTLYSDGIAAVLVDEELPHVNQSDADDWAQLNLLSLATPELRVETVSFRPVSSGEVDAVLALDIADKVTVSFQPPGGGDPVSRVAFVAGIEHRVAPGRDWVVVFTLASASRYNFLRYDDPDTVLDIAGFAPGTGDTFTGGRFEAPAGELVWRGDIEALQTQMVLRYQSQGEVDADYPTPEVGALIWRADRGLTYWNGSAWVLPVTGV